MTESKFDEMKGRAKEAACAMSPGQPLRRAEPAVLRTEPAVVLPAPPHPWGP